MLIHPKKITIPTANIVPGRAYPQEARKINDFWKLLDLYCEIIIKNIEASITKNAIFSDGEELGDANGNVQYRYSVIFKLDGDTGDLLWKTYTGIRTDEGNNANNSILIKNDGTILSFISSWIWNEQEDQTYVHEVNSTNGSITLVGGVNHAIYNLEDITIDSDNNIYAAGYTYIYPTGTWIGVIEKYAASDYSEVWSMNLENFFCIILTN